MRLQLAFQDFQLRLRQLPFELRGANSRIALAEVIVQPIKDSHDHPVHPQIPRNALPEKNAHEAPRRSRHIRQIALGLRERNRRDCNHQQNRNRERAMRHDPITGRHTEPSHALAEKQNYRRKHGPNRVRDDGEITCIPPAHRMARHLRVHEIIYGQQNGEVAPRPGNYRHPPSAAPRARSSSFHAPSLAHPLPAQ